MTYANTYYDPLKAKLHLVINDELYPIDVVYLWNDYCEAKGKTEEIIYPFCGDTIDEVLKAWSPSKIVFALQRTDERDEWFQVSEADSEIVCFPDWEMGNYVDEFALVDWLFKGNRWKKYDALKSGVDEATL